MSEFVTSVLLIGSETAVVLMLLAGVVVFFNMRRHRQNKTRAMELVNKLKKNEPEKCNKLQLLLMECYGLEEEAAKEKMEELMSKEKALYSKILNMYMGRGRDSIMGLDQDVLSLVESYRELFEGGGDGNNDDEEGRPSSPLILRKENALLREAKAQLEMDLAAAMETMENMMAEYASMYEGGRKEGEKRLKNEMFKLQQKLERRVDKIEVDADEPESG